MSHCCLDQDGSLSHICLVSRLTYPSLIFCLKNSARPLIFFPFFVFSFCYIFIDFCYCRLAFLVFRSFQMVLMMMVISMGDRQGCMACIFRQQCWQNSRYFEFFFGFGGREFSTFQWDSFFESFSQIFELDLQGQAFSFFQVYDYSSLSVCCDSNFSRMEQPEERLYYQKDSAYSKTDGDSYCFTFEVPFDFYALIQFHYSMILQAISAWVRLGKSLMYVVKADWVNFFSNCFMGVMGIVVCGL